MIYVVIFILTLSVYVFTGYPTIMTGDAGEFVTGAVTLGISHPPGYPLFLLLGKMFSLINISNPAWRISFLTMVLSSLSAVYLYLIVDRIAQNRYISFVSVLSFSLASLVWSQSIIGKGVYCLNSLFLLISVYILLKWDTSSSNKYLYFFSLVFGLSLTNHYPLMMLAFPGFFVFLLFNHARLKPAYITIMALIASSGVLVYGYLLIRAGKNPPLNWGNPEDLGSFISHVLRKQYNVLELGKRAGLADKARFVLVNLRDMFTNYGGLAGVAILGLAANFKQNRRYFVSFVLIFLFNTFGLVYALEFPYNPERVGVMSVYYIPSYVMISIWIGYGLKFLFLYKKGAFYRAGLVFLVAILIFINISNALTVNNQRFNFIEYNYCKNVLKSVEKNSVLFIQDAGDESLFGLLYFNKVVGLRKDLTIYDCWGNVFKNIYGKGFNLLTDKSKWLKTRKLAEEKVINQNSDVYYLMFSKANYVISLPHESVGLTNKVKGNKSSLGTANKPDFWEYYNLTDMYTVKPIEYQEKEIIGNYLFQMGQNNKNYANLCYKQIFWSCMDVAWLMNNTGLIYLGNKEYEEAGKYFDKIIQNYPDYGSALYNLGLVYKSLDETDKAIKSLNAYASYNPNDLDAGRELVELYWKTDLREKAVKILSGILVGNKDIADGYLYKGAEFYKNGKYRQALDEWEKGVIVKPDYALIYYNMGVACLDIKNIPNAIMYLKKYLEIEPNGKQSESVRDYLTKIVQPR